jgi:exonuclease SbcC
MRLHQLGVTAFGPFADTVEVDFDTLSEAGLFLLAGPTGAGKTSVLDAVCFALYGDVPGDRGSARRLRSDLAPGGLAPRVRLELTLAGRRFRLTRSPQWTRPKRRGSGSTRQQASVLVEERLEGSWTALTTRLDEAGHLVQDLVGMTMAQFCQVALLPQGRFQAFLRARSDERHQLLEQLFSSRRFADIERWLRDKARALHRESESAFAGVAAVVHRVEEVSGASLPEELHPLVGPAGSGDLTDWVDGLVAAAVDDAATRAAAAHAASVADELARDRLAAGRRIAAAQQRHRWATVEGDRLSGQQPLHEDRVERVRTARRAAPVVPLHHLREAARTEARAADEAAHAACAAVSDLTQVPHPTLTDLDLTADATRSALTRSRALAPREQERSTLEGSVRAATAEAEALDAVIAELTARHRTQPDRLRDLRARLDAARTALRELDTAHAAAQELAAALDAARQLAAVRREREDAEARCRVAATRCHDLKETWLALREARLEGMAAEIALGLAAGASCPVCGSADHPHKAVPGPDAPDAVDEKAARRAHEDAEVARVALEDQLRELRSTEARLAGRAGDDSTAELEARLSAVRESADELDARAATAPELAQALATVEHEQAETDELLVARQGDRAATGARLEADRASLARTEHELDELLRDTGCTAVTDLVACRAEELSRLEHACKAVGAQEQTALRAAEADRAVADWLSENGFVDETATLAAVLPRTELDRLEREVAAHEEARAAVRAVLDDPEVIEAVGHPPADLDQLSASAATAADALRDAHTTHRTAATRRARLTDLATTLATRLDAWTPVRAAQEVAAELASLVEGTSADNELRMRLSAYVLAWRLGQVVDAANERLLHMSDQRYTLEHTARRGAGERRGGLSLAVRDEWSGDARDPATLSGGETFVVSLALALGLADVVSREAGGTELDTLFVDEGFGTLDSDTLDGVMDTLDTLREGGRVVGVVSHVAELRSRIPVRLQVAKTRHGSTVRLERACD